MSSETVAKTVGKKLRYYFERRKWDNVVQSSPYKENLVYHVKRSYSFTQHPTMPEWMYRNHPTQGRTIKPELVGFGVGLKSQKHKRIKGGFPVMRSVPSSKVTRGEAHRLIDVATKILVATERVQDMKSRPGSPTRKPAAPAPFETSKPLPDNTRGQRKKRPSTAKYSWDIHGRRHVRVKSYDDSFIPDWIMTQKKEHPEPPKEERPKTPEPKPSPRPRSAKYRHREATVINVPEPSVRREVVVNQGSQTADDVGIQTEKKLLEEYDHGKGFAWFLDGVSVYDMHEKRIYEFVCADWLSGRDGDRQTYKELKLDCERAFVEAYDDVRERSYPQAGRDRRKDENSNESKASKNDKRSVESIQGSRGERHSDSDDTSTSYSSSSSSNSGRGRRLSPRSKTPTKPREPSPPRQAAKDDFFDAKVSGPTFTFRSSKEDEVIQEEYLSGYKAGLNAASAEQKQEHKKEDAAKKSVLKGPTVHDAARSGDLDRMQTLLNYYPEMKEAKDESGLTPLHVSTQQGRLDIVLAAMGAALTCRSVDKQTPLHVAAMNGHLECVKWLIANRASLTTEDQLGRTALALADEYQHKEVAEFIQKCIDEARDPSSSLYAMRSSRKGLGTIEEDSSPRQERSTMWQNDTNPDSACANVGSESEGRKAREKHNSQSVQKRRLYEDQQRRMESTHTSFLDSIRSEATE
ncbi:ESPN-like protein [Mya arenaria]|uniref:ESPN-like protein n=1 Tax=Mya arenaria TaxID=6604 RepID=A0ABY7DL52_MYAAR|nr:ESPN-like protein [Mya arenaria]